MVAPHIRLYIQRGFSFLDNFLVEDRGAGQEQLGFVVARSGEAAEWSLVPLPTGGRRDK